MQKKTTKTKRTSKPRREGQLHSLVSHDFDNSSSVCVYDDNSLELSIQANGHRVTFNISPDKTEDLINAILQNKALNKIRTKKIKYDDFPVIDTFIPGKISRKLPLKSA